MKLEDVAKRAKVSVATVSRALNETGPVRNTTKARVLKVVQRSQVSSQYPRSNLSGRQKPHVGYDRLQSGEPVFLDIFRSLESEARRHAYEVVVANTDYNPRRLVNSVHLMMGRRVAGLAVIVSEGANPHAGAHRVKSPHCLLRRGDAGEKHFEHPGELSKGNSKDREYLTRSGTGTWPLWATIPAGAAP